MRPALPTSSSMEAMRGGEYDSERFRPIPPYVVDPPAGLYLLGRDL